MTPPAPSAAVTGADEDLTRALTRPPEERFPALDGLRGLAALAILAFHLAGHAGIFFDRWWAAGLNHLNASLGVFFVISGFVLMRPFARRRAQDRPQPLVRVYLWRRAFRILPAYWATLLLLSIWPGLDFAGGLAMHLTLTQVWDPDIVYFGNSAAWSLGVELVFYLLLPLMVLVAIRPATGSGRVRVAVAGAGLFVACSLVAQVASAGKLDDRWILLTAGNVGYFAIGAALAVASAHGALPRLAMRVALPLALAAYGACVWLTPLSHRFDQRGAPLAVLAEQLCYLTLATALVWAAVSPRRERLRILEHRVVLWMGTVSYGVYLWHFPITAEVVSWHPPAPPGMGLLVIALIVLALVYPLAAATWYLVERPLIRFAARWSP